MSNSFIEITNASKVFRDVSADVLKGWKSGRGKSAAAAGWNVLVFLSFRRSPSSAIEFSRRLVVLVSRERASAICWDVSGLFERTTSSMIFDTFNFWFLAI